MSTSRVIRTRKRTADQDELPVTKLDEKSTKCLKNNDKESSRSQEANHFTGDTLIENIVKDEAEDDILCAESVEHNDTNNISKSVTESAFPFNLQEAMHQLRASGSLWSTIIDNVPFRPKDIRNRTMRDPFRALAISIISQQVSTVASSAITARFIAIFYPEVTAQVETMKERAVKGAPVNIYELPFPTAQQVANMEGDVPTILRGVGLSKAKVTYIMDLADKFANGHIDREKLMKMDDDEIYKTLIAIKGVGRWTVDIFLMFTMNRPNILPHGDLGLQRNVLKFLVKQIEIEHGTKIPKDDVLLSPDSDLTYKKAKSRLEGKGLPKKGTYVLPNEMTALTKQWEPYRSVAMWYMWHFERSEKKQIDSKMYESN